MTFLLNEQSSKYKRFWQYVILKSIESKGSGTSLNLSPTEISKYLRCICDKSIEESLQRI